MDLSEIVLWHNLEHTLPPPPISLKPFLFSLYVLFDEKLTTNYWKKTITHIENHQVLFTLQESTELHLMKSNFCKSWGIQT